MTNTSHTIDTDIRHLALESLYERYHPAWVEKFGWHLPAEFRGLQQEYQALKTFCVVIDKSYYGQITITGSTAQDFLHRMTSAPVNNLQPDQGMETVVTTAEGRFIDWVTVYLTGENELFMLTGPTSEDRIIDHLNEYIFFKDEVYFEKTGQQQSMLQVSGPAAGDLVREAFELDLDPGKHYQIHTCSLEKGSLTGIPYDDITGRDIMLLFPNEIGESVWEMLEAAGQFWEPMGCDAYDLARIETGIPACPNEINERHIPPEAHIHRSVDLDTCFAGQEVIARTINYDKVKQHLFHIEIQAEPAQSLTAPLPIRKADRRIGEVTSLRWSPMHNRYLGLGYIRTRHMDENLPVIIQSEDSTFEGLATRKTSQR
ncbi:MAG TPA: glycine cleavage T C-terminal barrel domain-containing protein [bacterium]|nr:glycine cleavage T C-terminal barrel domain-containing protein [bacterium]